LKAPDTGLVFSNLMNSIKSFANVSAKVFTRIELFKSVLFVSMMVSAFADALGITNLGDMLRRRVAEARTHPAEEHISGPSPGVGIDGGSPDGG
jgi:hypothetical protein